MLTAILIVLIVVGLNVGHTKVLIMAKLSTLAATLQTLVEQTTKIATEVQALKDALSDVDIPAEAQTALDNLTTALKTVDDLNPDKPTEPPTT